MRRGRDGQSKNVGQVFILEDRATGSASRPSRSGWTVMSLNVLADIRLTSSDTQCRLWPHCWKEAFARHSRLLLAAVPIAVMTLPNDSGIWWARRACQEPAFRGENKLEMVGYAFHESQIN